jgi:hypothetical protein
MVRVDTGRPLEKFTAHNQLLRGGFGCRLDVDGTEKSVQAGCPVSKLLKADVTLDAKLLN